MKHVVLVVLLGAVAGLISHVLWFSARRPAVIDSPESALAWLQQDLQLNPAQFARVKAVHESSGPQLQELAERAARLRAEFAAFERQRETAGEIDFLAFAQFVEQQRAFDRVCLESTRRVLTAAAEEMDAHQRERYLDRFGPLLRSRISGLN